MTKLEEIITGSITPGIYRWQSRRQFASIAAECEAKGWYTGVLDGDTIQDKASFLAAWGTALAYPSYAQPNWDSFEECLNDLHWLANPGILLIYNNPDPFAEAQPAEWQLACEIIAEAISNWHSRSKRIYLLLRAAKRRVGAFPEL
jgi:Barstar (barnase inhibitor)